MGDIAKGVLGGGWTLVIGWILPTALNLAVFQVAIAPSLSRPGFLNLPQGKTTVTLLVVAVLFGLVLNALQTPLYRLLEGYALWPAPLYERGCTMQRRRRQRMADRLTSPVASSSIRRALLREKLARYPDSDDQITPTRLGNAIRRLENYGYDRYRLDTQVLWNELTSSVPDWVRKQNDAARATVDFFVALLYGHAVMCVAALAALAGPHAHRMVLIVTAVCLAGLVPVWYHAAVTATDEWAAAVRALVNLGRKPLANALGLLLPKDLQEERTMWQLVTRMSRRPYAPAARDALMPYRVEQPNDQPPAS